MTNPGGSFSSNYPNWRTRGGIDVITQVRKRTCDIATQRTAITAVSGQSGEWGTASPPRLRELVAQIVGRASMRRVPAPPNFSMAIRFNPNSGFSGLLKIGFAGFRAFMLRDIRFSC